MKRQMVRMVGRFAAVALMASGAWGASAEEADVVIYGSTPGGIAAAVQAKRMGRSVVLLEPTDRIGGLTTGGLGQTDIGNKAAFGGIARSFYADVAKHYAKDESWRWENRTDYLPDGQCAGTKGSETMWTFEPSAALAVLTEWERREGIRIVRNAKLDREKGKVKVEGEGERRRIVSLVTTDGTVYRGKMFIDATYEGDLMAAAGVRYTVGREANSKYGETLNGMQPIGHPHHNFNVPVDPYVVKGDPKSGLLPGIEPEPMGSVGAGDRRVQAYCFRMTLTDRPENRIPFAKPDGYDERDYELLFRYYEAGAEKFGLPWINSRMPNRKTDTNNRCGFSTDFIGQNHAWPDASYAEREKIFAAHLRYQQGLMWTMANHPRIPEAVRDVYSKWGMCRDEFTATGGWTPQLYVREARRLVGDYVMTEANCVKDRVAPRPVALAAYQMDSHHVRRYVTSEGHVRNEGDVEVDCSKGPFGIDYGAIVSKRGDCANLFVPVCLSASHIAFGSIRMEPVFFALGQAAGTAAALSIADGCAVQDLDYGKLRMRLLADGQRLPPETLTAREARPSGRLSRTVVIAAANSTEADKASADLVCEGRNDERTLNRAIAALDRGGTIQLLDGDYSIDAFENEGDSAVFFGYNEGRARTINIVGSTENKSYNTHFGTVFHVSAAAMGKMSTNGVYRVFYGTAKRPKAPGDFFTMTHLNNVNFDNFYLFFADASKPLRGIDGSNFGSTYISQVGIYTERYFQDRFLHVKPATPCRGSVGVWSVPSSNDEMARIAYDTVCVGGLYIGFYQDMVDKLIMRTCTTARCCYGYWFRGGPKTLTMINCSDEGNAHLPRFERGEWSGGHISAIDFNIERFNAAHVPDSPDGDVNRQATESHPGSWGGYIGYTLQGAAFGLKNFWAEGSGHNIKTVNMYHSRDRRPDTPEYLETYYDAAKNALMLWNGKTWVEFVGKNAE